jgi:hypothetical protein
VGDLRSSQFKNSSSYSRFRNTVESFESRCGHQSPDILGSTVWSHITLGGSDEAVEGLDIDVRGEYELLQNCGSALGSLHRRAAVGGDPLYLFLDPQKLGPPEFDTYVIASTHERIIGDKQRQVITELDHKWRASTLDVSNLDDKSPPVNCFYKKWFKCPDVFLEGFKPSRPIVCQSLKPFAIDLDSYLCNEANVTLLKISVPTEILDLPCMAGSWNLAESITCLRDFSWILQKVSLLTEFEDWNFVTCDSNVTGETICSTCAPRKPGMIWKEGSSGRMKPVEDPFQASIYERQIKARPAPFMGFTTVENGLSNLIISINIKTLLHQAYGKLVGSNANANVSLSWRLLPKSPDLREYNFGKFVLKSNVADPQCQQPPNFGGYKLRPEQLRSLTWMMSCEEENAPPFEEEEVEEALLPFLMWRAEAKVTMEKIVRGGILADEVGYGKTALILGLIDSQYASDKMRSRDLTVDGTIPLKATLIIATKIMVAQWESEIKKFLRNKYKVLTISTIHQLYKQTIANFQDADIILVSTSLFTGSTYYIELGEVAKSPVPKDANNGGRIFDHWLFRALESTSEYVNTSCNQGRDTMNLDTNRPSKRLRGKNGAARKRKLDAVDKNQSDQNLGDSWNPRRNVLFHMFSYNRLVIDEFACDEPKRKVAALWALKARSKWALSGTPPLNDFAGVKYIASFLGVRLGGDDIDADRDRSGN